MLSKKKKQKQQKKQNQMMQAAQALKEKDFTDPIPSKSDLKEKFDLIQK